MLVFATLHFVSDNERLPCENTFAKKKKLRVSAFCDVIVVFSPELLLLRLILRDHNNVVELLSIGPFNNMRS